VRHTSGLDCTKSEEILTAVNFTYNRIFITEHDKLNCKEHVDRVSSDRVSSKAHIEKL
jgi:hypothetical protein